MDGGNERTGSSSETTGREREGTRGRERRHLDRRYVCRVESCYVSGEEAIRRLLRVFVIIDMMMKRRDLF